MSNPTVCAICLVNGRPELVQRAIRSFESQTYENKSLVIYDTTPEDVPTVYYPGFVRAVYEWPDHGKGIRTIGELRNAANGHVDEDSEEIIIHWDSDDWSHPRRIEEQVELLQASGKDCVGYREMLFWNETKGHFCGAYLYTNPQPSYALGTSLCYWRKAWEQNKFADLPKHATGGGEDTDFIRRVDTLGVNIVPGRQGRDTHLPLREDEQPRMIAALHGENTSSITALAIKHGDTMIRRVTEWDAYCRDRMAL